MIFNLTKQIFGLGGFEWVFVVIIGVLLFFGAKKIPELARGIGKAKYEFEKAKIESRKEIENIKRQGTSNPNIDREKLESIADSLGIDYTDKSDEDLKRAIDLKLKEK